MGVRLCLQTQYVKTGFLFCILVLCYIFLLLLFLFIFWKCKPVNTVIDGADHSVDIVDRLTWHLYVGGIYKRMNKKTKNYTRVGRLEKHVQNYEKR